MLAETVQVQASPVGVLDRPTTFPVAMSLSEGTDPPMYRSTDEIQGVVKARVSTSSVSAGFKDLVRVPADEYRIYI